MNRPLLLGSALIVGAASLFGTLGYMSRVVAGLGLASTAFVVWRASVGALVMLVFIGAMASRRRAKEAGGGPVGRFLLLGGRGRLALLVGAIFGAMLNIAMFAAFQRMSIAVALICFYSFPALVTVAAVPLYGDRLEPRRLAALGLSLGGLLLVLLAPLVGNANGLVVDPGGVALALFAAVCQTSWFLIGGRGFAPMTSFDVSAALQAATVVIATGLLVVTGDAGNLLVPASEPRLWPWLLAAGLAGAAIPTTAFMAGLTRIGPSRAAVLMTFEPVVGVSLAALLLGEQPVPLQLVGGAAVICAAALLQTIPTRAPIEPEPPLV